MPVLNSLRLEPVEVPVELVLYAAKSKVSLQYQARRGAVVDLLMAMAIDYHVLVKMEDYDWAQRSPGSTTAFKRDLVDYKLWTQEGNNTFACRIF